MASRFHFSPYLQPNFGHAPTIPYGSQIKVHRAVIKRCTHFGGAVVSVSRADTELLVRCRALKQRSIAVMNLSFALVWMCLCGTNARFRSLPLRQRYSNADFIDAPLRQRMCFPHFVRGDERCRNFVPSHYRSWNAITTFVRWA